ncbi:hypothetical protein A1O3_05124 [Capronia epimyces CBS 606.96]|uniref:Cytoplasmic tRNA 2-thiolation protein 2 n=1 Tax=Capronia epimyces CBS 606.96 TaxID=1182542 RepID=W9Y5H0_9EURO|nr:uncharacterized protein A1O3_05124 [Capronia epimyces CBS 606.96]EXJ84456.1 hypothetical protein A1O3_05124 [Capronia epimyces CBS 606.96]
MDDPATTDLCVDCRERDASLSIRNRRLCSACFMRYVTSKVLKRMESFRFKTLSGDDRRRLLLPVSGGVSSLVLLHVLDAQLQRQIASRNRTAYDLVVLRVVLPEDEGSTTLKGDYEELARKFSAHRILPLLDLQAVFKLDTHIERDFEHLGLRRHGSESDESFLNRMLSCATSVTARADLQSILLQRLIVSAARQHGCESVVWGHSDSRLAALVLADVAKGRGGSVPSTIADGPSLHGINSNYPMRDLFKTELQSYAQLVPDPLLAKVADSGETTAPPTAMRHTSIDTLLRTYIHSQGEKYPGIMANVVRTASKLDGRQASTITATCPVCIRLIVRSQGLLNPDGNLCYGCDRMRNDIKS